MRTARHRICSLLLWGTLLGSAACRSQPPSAHPAASSPPRARPAEARFRGVPLQRFGYREFEGADGLKQRVKWVIPGVYELATRRFHALGPEIASPAVAEPLAPLAAALVDPASGRIVAVTGTGNNADVPSIASLQIRLYRMTRFVIRDGGHTERPELERSVLEGASAQLVELLVSEHGVRFRPYDCEQPCSFRAWQSLSQAGERRSEMQRDDGAPRLLVTQAGILLSGGLPPGFALHGRKLQTPRGAVELAAAAASAWTFVRLSPDARRAVVVTLHGDIFATGMSEEPDLHDVESIDLETLALQPIAQGTGFAAVAFDASGALYLESQGRVRVLPSGEALPEGLSL
jgi:hypothetical protein